MQYFSHDLRRWKRRDLRPADATPLPIAVGAGDVIRLFWRYPGVWATALFRAAAWSHRHRIRGLPAILERLNFTLCGIEISSSIDVGPGLYIAHPAGSVIMAERIGANVSFIHAVTLGMRNEFSFPVLGDAVFVGAGARILGGVRLGDGCSIGANAVVIDDVPAGANAVGVPARVVGGGPPEKQEGAAAAASRGTRPSR